MPGTGKYEPKTTRENKGADASGKTRAARERVKLNQSVAASNPRNNPQPNVYLPHQADVSAEVDAQIKRDRGAPHSRK